MNNNARKPFVHWVYILKDDRFKCPLWSNIYFDLFKFQMGAPPSGCQSCWKTVVRPRTLRELFKMKDIQAQLDVHSKCGIHLSKDMFGLYQAVFYKRSLEEALEQYSEIRKIVDEKIGEDCSVIVKRGCTKMEKIFPNTKEWEVSPRQQNIENALDTLIEFENTLTPQNKLINDATMQMWIEEAYKIGDETYRNFTNGKDIGVVNVTYHEKQIDSKGEVTKNG